MFIYVDDVIVTGNDKNIIDSLISTLSKEFSLKDLGQLHYFLGLEVRNFSRGIFVFQTKYIKDLLDGVKKLKCCYSNMFMVIKPIVTSFDDNPLIQRFIGNWLSPCNISHLQDRIVYM